MPRSKNKEKKMDLILWRHAEAEDAAGELPDARRRLTAYGEKQAANMGQWLKKRLPKKVRILVSPTERTQMTARALGLPFEIDDRIGTTASADDLVAAAGWPDDGGTVVIVGHQPTLGRVASRLLTGHDLDWKIKKAGVMWVMGGTAGDTRADLRLAIGSELV